MKARVAVIVALVLARNKDEGDKLKNIVSFSEDFDKQEGRSKSWGFESIRTASFMSIL